MLEEQGRLRFIDQDDFALHPLHKRDKVNRGRRASLRFAPASPSYDSIAAVACKPKLNAEGVAVLPADWGGGDGSQCD